MGMDLGTQLQECNLSGFFLFYFTFFFQQDRGYGGEEQGLAESLARVDQYSLRHCYIGTYEDSQVILSSLSLSLSIHPSTHPIIHSSIHPLSVFLFACLSIYLSIIYHIYISLEHETVSLQPRLLSAHGSSTLSLLNVDNLSSWFWV